MPASATAKAGQPTPGAAYSGASAHELVARPANCRSSATRSNPSGALEANGASNPATATAAINPPAITPRVEQRPVRRRRAANASAKIATVIKASLRPITA